QQPDEDSSIGPGSAARPEPSEARQSDREEKEDEEDEEGGPGQESAQEQRLDPEWVEERFRIDRKKLENMLYAPNIGNSETGEEFFERVMRETDTQVKWPSKLKIGAKSKKDPHVKVEGRRDNVVEAKKKILEVLETKVNKVTLKMDVAYTEHSHVIGKGGVNIKKVMEVTSCHIHFPDSNRHNAAGEKSNQVSIAGPIEGVEDARRRIRDLQPLSLTFDLPVSMVPQTLPDAGSPLIQQVVQTLGVNVSFRAVPPHPQAQPSLYESCCTVWGLQGNAPAVKKATCILMDLLLGSEVTVNSQLDVTSQQHLFLMGQNGAHFLSVMHQTQTQIILPDLSAPQSPPSLLIQGSPDGVCLARQQLMDCLPVCLMFDLREDGDADPCKLAQMMQNLGVFISVKPKAKQTSKSVVVKGLERNISCLFEARRQLLGLGACDSAKVTQMTPDPALASTGPSNYWFNMLLQQLRLSEQVLVIEGSALAAEVQNSAKPRPTPPPGLTAPPDEGKTGLKGTDSRLLEKILEAEDVSGQSEEELSKTSSSEVCDAGRSIARMGIMARRGSHDDCSSSCSHHLQSDRLMSTEMEDKRSERRSSLRRDAVLGPDLLSSEDYDYEKKKLLAARAMQRKPVFTEVRTPTDTWSGLGFSKSMPAEAAKELRNISRRCYKPYLSTIGSQQNQSWAAQLTKVSNGSDSENWRDRRGSASSSVPGEGSLSNSGYFEGFCSSRRASTCSQHSLSSQITDGLPELLSQLGLMKYIDIFEQQEIDYQTFLTLSDEDLKEVGVFTFGARRKMLLAIAELNKSKRRLSDTPAVKPGYLEGGASGRLPRIMDVDAAQSNQW
uniref:Bicaudal C homolog 2 n=1 Tax=Tetraodon nigroviridis TaxID=99883 RepID=H3D9M8_TETNG